MDVVHESLELPNKIHCARFTDLRQSEISHIRDLPIKYRSFGKVLWGDLMVVNILVLGLQFE